MYMNYPSGLGANERLHLATSSLLKAVSVNDYACAIVSYGRGRRSRSRWLPFLGLVLGLGQVLPGWAKF